MKITNKLLCLLMALFSYGVKAQMSGTYNVPTNFTSLAAAISSLNAVGVSGAVTININAGYTETATVGGYTLNAIAGASSANTITFQKTGAGANPLISAYAGGTATPSSAIQDGVWRFSGTDWVIVDGIDITDPNTANPATMEFGFGFFKAGATDGCNNNIIRNCTITLNRVNNAAGAGPALDGSRGIDLVNAAMITHTTALTPTSAAGSNSNNKFYSNTIQNCNTGISLRGFADATPFALSDAGNDVGGSSIATGNSIINFGGGGTVTAAYGVVTLAQYSLNISYNTVNNNTGSGINHAQVLKGILTNAAISANVSINNNTVTLKSGGTTQNLTGIENNAGATAAANAVNMNNNLIANFTYTGATSASFNGIMNFAASATISMSGNTFSNNTLAGTSSTGGFIHNSGAGSVLVNINNNVGTSNALTFTGANGGSFNFIYSNGAASTASLNINGNNIQGISNAVTGSTGYGLIVNNPTCFYQSISNNLFTNLTLNTTGSVTFIGNNITIPAGSIQNINGNSIVTGFNKSGAGGTVILYTTNASSAAGAICNNNNNNFSNITLTGATTMSGWSNTDGGSPTKIVTGNVFSNWVCGTSAVICMNINYFGNNSSVSSNTISNISGGNSITGIAYGANGTSTLCTVASNMLSSFTTTGGAITGITTAGSPTTFNFNNNSVSGFSTTSGSAVYGIVIGSSATMSNIFKNKIYDLQANNAAGVVNGLRVTSGTNNIYNNLIGDLRTPSSTGTSASLLGINLTGGTLMNVFFNTVYLNAASTGSIFGSAAIMASSTPSLDLRNNILVNNSTATGQGIAAAYFRSSTTLGTYLATSNNNLFYAGTPSANNMIYYDGTNALQTLSAFKVLTGTRDALSVTENPTFVSTTGSNANFLNINTTTPTQIESRAIPIAGITDDYAATVRNLTTPDIGAWEGTFTSVPACSGTPTIGSLASTQAAVCPSVSFNVFTTSSFSNTGIGYQWMASTTGSASGFAAITGATLATVSNTNLTATTWYQLQVTCGASTATSTPLMVSAAPPTLNSVANTTFICATQSVNLSLSGSLSGVVYQWMASSTSSSTGFASVPNATLATASTTGAVGSNWYQAVVSCSANTTFSTVTVPVTLTVGVIPTASVASSAGTLCAAATLSLTGSTDVGTSFIWRGPSSYTSNVQNPVLTGFSAGVYSLVTSLNTCSSTAATVALAVNGVITISTPVATPSSVCLGNTTTLSIDNPSARVSKYVFSSSTGAALMPMTTGSVSITGSGADDAASTARAIGFNFGFNGTSYSSVSVSPDGWFRLGSGTGTDEFANNVISTTNIPKIYPYWDDMHTGTNGYIRSQLFGAAPTRTYVMEWFVTIPRNATGAANSTFQALISEANGSVEFRYGAMGTDATGLSSAGLTGDATAFHSITYTNSTSSTITPNNSNATQPALGTSYLFSMPVTYTWTPAATLSSTSLIAVTSTPVVGTTIYSINVSYEGCISTKTVAVLATTPVTVNIAASAASICPGGSATLTASGATTYSWNTSSTNTVLTVSPSGSLTTYTVVGRSAACSDTKTVSVSVPGNPTLNIVGGTGICTGETLTLTTTGSPVTYSWSTGATTSSITDVPAVTTVYTVTGTDALGCKTSKTQTVNVGTTLTLSVSGPTALCPGQTPTLSVNGGLTYTWSTSASDMTIAPTPTLGVNSYSVVGASGTCSNSAVFNLTVNPTPVLSVTGTTVICLGKTTTLTVGGAQTYTWNPSPVSLSVAVTPTGNTTYSVSGTSTAGCLGSTTVAVITNSLPVITIAQSATAVCLQTSGSFTASGANTFTWTGGPNTADYTVTPTATTVYTVSGTNAANCVNTKTVSMVSYTLPVISIAPAALTVCANSTVALTASGASTYTWSGIATPSAVGIYTVATPTSYTVTGTTTQGCVSSKTISLGTNPLPITTISPASRTVCSMAAASFTASSTLPGVSFIWNNSIFVSPVFLGVPSTNTTYSVVASTPLGCSLTTTVAVTTLSLPVIVVTPSQVSVCDGSTNTYTASGANSYTWSTAAQTNTIAVTSTLSGGYTVDGIGANGCMSTGYLNITVNPLPILSFSPVSATVCPGAAAGFTALGATNYTWSNGPLTSTVIVNPTSATVYTVTGMDANGCTGTKTVAVSTRSVPVISVTPLSTSVCIGASSEFTASGANSYTWSNASTSTMIAVSPTITTTYTVTGRNTIGCTSTKTVEVNIWQLPTIGISPVSPTICAKEEVTFIATGASNYTWFPNNVNSATLTSNPSFSVQYTVYGMDLNGCSNSNTVMVYVEKCTGIEKNSSFSNMISVYPNPSTGFVTAKFGFEGQKNIVIMNSVGAVVSEVSTENDMEVLNLSDNAKGVYFIKITSKGNTSNYKVIVE